MNGQNNNMSARVNIEDSRIRLGFSEADVSESAANNLVPFASSLFKSINRFVEFDAIFLWVRFLVAWWLLHKNLLVRVQYPVKESTVKIEHFDFPIVSSCDCEYGADRGEFGDGGKCFVVVDAVYLSKSFGDEAGLVALDFADRVDELGIGLCRNSHHFR